MANFMTVRSPMHSRNLCLAVLSLTLLLPILADAQPTNTAPPVSYASVNELNNLLDQVKQMAQNIQADLSKSRVDRWKADSATKRQVQANVESIQRNLQSAL